ncbi:MAG: response regulator [Bryobacteraceae bacterium]|jgi:Flp pilus assembly CpaE family ATPase
MSDSELRLLIVDNAEEARNVREMLESAVGPRFHIQIAENLVSALNALAHQSIDVVLVELALVDAQGLATFETIQRHAHGLPIVIYTATPNESQDIAAVERGAQDYLVKGRTSGQALARVLQHSVARHRRAADTVKGENVEARVIGFLAVKGGVGATTLATHFSVELARQTHARVLLMDLDMSGRSAACLLKADARYTVADAATNLHRLDADFWSRIVFVTGFGFDLLQAPGAVGSFDQLSGERVRHVLRFARTLYRYIVVDLGRACPVSLRLLEELSEVYVVTTSGMLEVYETSRVLNKLESLKLNENQLRLIINRVAGPSFVTKPAIEKALGHSACWTLPDYSSELEAAYGSGNFIDQARSLRRQCEQLVARSLGTPKDDPVTQPSFWSSSLDSLRRALSPRSRGGRNGARSGVSREKIALEIPHASRAPLAANEQSPFPIQLNPPGY